MAEKNFTIQGKNNAITNLEKRVTKVAVKKLEGGDFTRIVIMLTLFLAALLISSKSFSASKKIQEVNYFSSLRANDTNVRSGPGKNYPVKFTFKLRSVPVRVISEYDNWNEIEDLEGQSGWVVQALLTKKRTLITKISKSFTNLHAKPNDKSRVIYRLENHVVGDYLKCNKNWCAMKVKSKKGWVRKSDLFGWE